MTRGDRLAVAFILSWPLILVAGLYLYLVADVWPAYGLITYCAASSVGFVMLIVFMARHGVRWWR